MTEEPRAGTGRAAWRHALLRIAATTLAVTAAYQFAMPVAVDFESPWPVPVATHGVYPVEDGFRWTSGRGALRLAGPGPRRTVKVEASLSAWRPRGAPPTQVRLSIGTAGVVALVGPAPAEISLVADTGTSATGEVEVRLESNSFAPGLAALGPAAATPLLAGSIR